MALQRWSEIVWEARQKLVRIWVRLDGRSDGWLGVGEPHDKRPTHQRALAGFLREVGGLAWKSLRTRSRR